MAFVSDRAEPLPDDRQSDAAQPCVRFEPMQAAYAAGELAAGERAEMAAHLVDCAPCQARVDSYGRLRRLTREIGEAERASNLASEELIADILATAQIAPPTSDD